MKRIAVFFILPIALALAIATFPRRTSAAPSPGSSATTSSGKWVCPPCTGGCDETIYDHGGACPVCGMALVDAATVRAASKTRNLAILLFDGVQIIDYSGPWEVFGQTSVDEGPAFRIYTVAKESRPVTTSMGQSVNPKFTLANAPKPDVLLVPGGAVYATEQDPEVISWIARNGADSEVVLSVCTGAYLLAKAGLLDGKDATTIAGALEDFQHEFPKVHVVSDRRFADNGRVVTSAGLSSGIDAALHVVEKLYGRGKAQAIATNMEYEWRPDGGYVRAQLADRKLPDHLDAAWGNTPRRLVWTAGDRSAWEVRWSVESGSTPADLARLVARMDEALGKSERAKWSRGTPSREGAESRWRLTFPSGETWTGATSAKPDSVPGRALVAVRIERAGEKRAGR